MKFLSTSFLTLIVLFCCCFSVVSSQETQDSNQISQILDQLTNFTKYSLAKFKRSYFWLISGNPCGFKALPYNVTATNGEELQGYHFSSSDAGSACDTPEQFQALAVLLERTFDSRAGLTTTWCINVTESDSNEAFVVFGVYNGFNRNNCISYAMYTGQHQPIDEELERELQEEESKITGKENEESDTIEEPIKEIIDEVKQYEAKPETETETEKRDEL